MRRISAQHGFLASEFPGVFHGFQQQEILVCPKPRRATASLPEFLCPLAYSHR
ncbi:unnamed protein product [Spirodela intermedia]|uniref:Uncharacterized protein n=2 Tax=Spirodela intermedia TaxID=51605 RepID=A0A7I8IZU5_SPIIN|nr:unnamed protein product [Spirodela intermedia]CAA6663242.1 unnamed protein product [Spirodela intermedia]CAA7399689.1 unnamed protein product [Spirodela intermedia]